MTTNDELNQLTPQQQLVLEQKYTQLTMINAGNDHMDEKASSLLQSGGVVTGLIVAAGVVLGSLSTVSIVAVFLIALMYAIMIVLSAWAWMPTKYRLPGEIEWGDLFTAYLSVELETCFEQVLSDVLLAIDEARATSRHKAIRVQWAIRCFAIQMVAVLVVIVSF